MTLQKNEQVRHDLDRADAVIRACWDNFKATEPTFVLRDLIVIEIAKAREAEREKAAEDIERLRAQVAEFKNVLSRE